MTDDLTPNMLEQIDKAVTILRDGGIVAYPTDTVYGLGADIFNERAVDRIYTAKRRPYTLPLPVLISDIAQVGIVAKEISDFACVLMERFWPGGLTLILTAANRIPETITASTNRVALRVPNHAVPVALMRGLGGAMVGTSANISSEPSPLTAEDVARQLGDEVDMIIDGGACVGGIESTVVDVSDDKPIIVRHGAIPDEAIEETYEEYLRASGG